MPNQISEFRNLNAFLGIFIHSCGKFTVKTSCSSSVYYKPPLSVRQLHRGDVPLPANHAAVPVGQEPQRQAPLWQRPQGQRVERVCGAVRRLGHQGVLRGQRGQLQRDQHIRRGGQGRLDRRHLAEAHEGEAVPHLPGQDRRDHGRARQGRRRQLRRVSPG